MLNSFGYLLFLLIQLGLVTAIIVVTKLFLDREKEQRAREEKLIDRLLQKSGVQPLTVEREQVLRLADVEQPVETWTDSAMRADMILEEMEQILPDLRGCLPELAKEMYPHEWARIERRIAEEQTPLRVG